MSHTQYSWYRQFLHPLGGPALAAVVIAGNSVPCLGQTIDEQLRFMPGEIIIGLRTPEAAQELLANFRVRSAGTGDLTVDPVGPLAIRLVLPRFRSARSATERGTGSELNELQMLARDLTGSHRDVTYAHPNWVLANAIVPRPVSTTPAAVKPLPKKDATPNDPAFQTLHWHYRPNGTGNGHSAGGINLAAAWAHTKGDRRIVVAVLDTGILFDHPDIKGSNNVLRGYDFVTNPGFAADGDGRDEDPSDPGDGVGAEPSTWHGTHVAATIGAAGTNNSKGMSSINWEVSILPVRVLGRGGGSIQDIADGILWAAGVDIPATAGQARVPRNLNPAHVINLSIEAAGACAPEQFGVLRDAIDQATRAGSVVVSAAGNKTRDAANVTPASCPGSITVAASDTRGFHASRYSNFGVRVDVLAPGGDVARDDDMDGREDGIWSAVKPGPGNETGIASKNGTSMAAPHVSGVIALGMARMPELQRKPALVLQRLKASLRPIPSGACPQPCGIGMLDAEKFVAP